jgi:hypothetical protein
LLVQALIHPYGQNTTIVSTHALLTLSTGNPAYDLFKVSFVSDLAIDGIKPMVIAEVQMPPGTLKGLRIGAFNNAVPLTNNPQNVTVTYKDTTEGTVLGVASGRLTGTIGKPKAVQEGTR